MQHTILVGCSHPNCLTLAMKYQWPHFRFLFQGTTNLEILKIHHVPFIIIVCNGCKHLALILNIVEQLFVIPKSPF